MRERVRANWYDCRAQPQFGGMEESEVALSLHACYGCYHVQEVLSTTVILDNVRPTT